MANENYISTADLARILGITRQAVQKILKKETGIKIKKVGAGFLYEISSLPQEIKDRIAKERKEIVEEAVKLSRSPQKDIEFEKELWKAADRMRGNIDPADYKHVVLGLLFLKYVSDSYYNRRQELERRTADPKDKEYYIPDEKSRKAIIEDKDEYKKVGVFYIPEKARWDFLRSHAMHHDIGKYLDEAMEAIEEENPKQLKNVLPKIYTRTPLESHILGELVNIFSKIKFDHDIDREKDVLGRVYEYFLGQFASAEGKRGGEFYTPRSIVKLLVEILDPFENARIFDPACGSGGMFVQTDEYLRKKMGTKEPSRLSIFGQESNPTTWRLCRMNLAIRGIIGDIQLGNSYYDDKFPNLHADFVLANPPFNADWDPGRLSDKDPRIKFGIPPASNANFMWIQHFIHHLAPNGMAGFVMANGALAVGGREGEIRKKIIEEDLIDVIIACPPKLFYNVSLPVSLWFVSKSKKNGRFRDRIGETLFIDAREIYYPISRKQVVFTPDQIIYLAAITRLYRGEDISYASLEDIKRNAETYQGEIKELEELLSDKRILPEKRKSYQERIKELIGFLEINDKIEEEFKRNFLQGYKDIPGLCKKVNLEEIAKNGYVLTPGRYVGVAEEEDDGVPFEEKMEKLSSELKEYFAEGRKLEEEIIENLKKLKI